MHTSSASDKLRYRTIKSMHIKVKLLYDHGGTSDQDYTQWLPTPTVDDNGKVNIRKIWKDDLAFRMNTSSRKVLRKVLTGFIITEPDIRTGRINRGRKWCPRTKRVSRRSRLALFRCHEQTNLKREKEREREREKQKKFQTQLISIRRKGMVHMHEKCMNMWHATINTSGAQPNPILPAHMIST